MGRRVLKILLAKLHMPPLETVLQVDNGNLVLGATWHDQERAIVALDKGEVAPHREVLVAVAGEVELEVDEGGGGGAGLGQCALDIRLYDERK